MADHKHPLQPLAEDARGVVRFKENKIVRHLIDHGSIDLNALARLEFPQEDREQLAMLIGYSLDGFGTLSYVSDATYEAAARSRLLATPIAPKQHAKGSLDDETCAAIIRAACETDPADPDHPDTTSIAVSDLELIVMQALQARVTAPEGMMLVPCALTAENGAKAAMSGELSMPVKRTCQECDHDDPLPNCEVCGGYIEYVERIPVDWTTIKEIWAAGREHFSPSQPGTAGAGAHANKHGGAV